MKNMPSHGKGGRPGARGVDALRRSGLGSAGAAFAMIRRELQELRRPRAGTVSDEQLHDLAAEIAALRGNLEPGPDRDAFLREVKLLLAENLVTLKQQVTAAAANAVTGPAELIRRDVASLKEIQASVDRRTQDTFEAVYGTIERIADRLAALEDELRERGASGGEALASATDDTPTDDITDDETPDDETADDEMPDDDSAEPAVEDRGRPFAPAAVPAPRLADRTEAGRSQPARPNSARADSASPESASPGSAIAEPPGREFAGRGATPLTARLVAATAADAGAPEHVVLRRPAAFPDAVKAVLSAAEAEAAYEAAARASGIVGRKGFVIALGGVLLLVLAGALLTLDFYRVPAPPAGGRGEGAVSNPAGPAVAAAPEPARTDPGRGRGEPDPNVPGRDDGAPDAGGGGADVADAGLEAPQPSSGAAGRAPPQVRDAGVTAAGGEISSDGRSWDGSVIMRNPPLPTPPGRDPWSAAQPGDDPAQALPPAIGSKTLVAAAQAGDPAASYEIGMRLAQGKSGVTPDYVRAAVFLERAARAGVVPAQFRLGVLYERGQGVRKDLGEARRLYTAAAAKGHARAMHQLGEIFERGNGRPDHAAAAEWFRKAAGYGVADSQYALGVLFARGTGVERDPVEAFKWFALAAKGGNRDAVRARDETAARLGENDLEAARAGVEEFTAAPQPDQATATRAPPGGWGDPAVAATTKSRPGTRPGRFPDR